MLPLQGVSQPMIAKYPGRCAACHRDILPGDKIAFVKRRSVLNELRHARCLTSSEKRFRLRKRALQLLSD